MNQAGSVIRQLSGRAVVVRGNDIDTDRIIPARFLRSVTFEGLGQHAFADERKGGQHPFEDPRYSGANVLVVNGNFGCGSSREHAPQALIRWGIRAIVGESFAEIFRGNCTANGVPCLEAGEEEIAELMRSVEADPQQELVIDLEQMTLRHAGGPVAVRLPAGSRAQLVEGTWDATATLASGAEGARKVAARLPYITGF